MQLEVPDDDEDDELEDGESEDDEDDEDEVMTEDGDKVGDDDDSDSSVDLDPLDMPPNDVILANKRACPLFGRLFRSKGEFFLATRPHRAGEWSQAGAMITRRVVPGRRHDHSGRRPAVVLHPAPGELPYRRRRSRQARSIRHRQRR
jgi:hypothetical protein